MNLFKCLSFAALMTIPLSICSVGGFASSTPLPGPAPQPVCSVNVQLNASEVESGTVNLEALLGPACTCPTNADGRYDCSSDSAACDANGGRNECRRCNAIGC